MNELLLLDEQLVDHYGFFVTFFRLTCQPELGLFLISKFRNIQVLLLNFLLPVL
jgi:hypothetical protein